MKPHRVSCITAAFLLCLSFAAAAPQGADRGTIQVVVLKGETAEPVPDVAVDLVLYRVTPTGVNNFSTTTDDRGRFVFTNLEPGPYRTRFRISGYVMQEYGQRVFPGQGTPLNLAEGQSLENLVVRLTPTGTVSGRIISRSGQPLGNVPVELMRQSYTDTGAGRERQLQTARTTWTNDRGEYRIFYLTPGRYVLRAGQPPSGSSSRTGGAISRFVEDVALTYFPGVPSATDARTILVRAEEELSGADFVMDRLRAHNVRGRVVDSRTGAPPAAARISLVSPAGDNLRAAYTPSSGAFEFREVPEGRYTAVAATGSVATGLEMATPHEAAGSAELTLIGADLEGLLLTLKPGFSLSGRVRQDAAVPIDLTRINIFFRTPPNSTSPYTNQLGLQPQARADAAGGFRLESVWDSEYRLQVSSLPEGWYVKQAQLGGVDIRYTTFRVSNTPKDSLDILIGMDSSEIQVTALDANMKPVPGAQVVLVPDNGRDRPEMVRSGSADTEGRVTLSRVVPGDYTLLAWEAIEMNAWFDPDLVKEAEPAGKRLRIGEAAKLTAEVIALPAQ